MLLVGDLGFSSLALVLSFVLPLIGLFVRRKWRLYVARQAEIKKLLILASEEAARAELEATVGYGTVSITRNYPQCIVCYSPTTTRCAQCKAVRYCSAKCQIIHWRQGHKEECHPPSIATHHQNHDQGSDYGQKAVEQGHYSDECENEGKPHAKLSVTSSAESSLFNSTTEPALSSSSSSSVVLHEKDDDDDVKVEFHADGEGLNSASESSSATFSGFSSSAAGSESSDDVSVCESVSSNEPVKLESSLPADANLDTFWTSSVINNLDQTSPSSPKFVRLVDSVDKISKLNQTKPNQSGESQCRATSSSGLRVKDICDGSITDGSRLSSGFWDRTLESVPSTNVADNDNESFNSYHKGGKKASLDAGSSLQFSFTLSGKVSSSHPHGSKVKDAKLDDAPQGATALGHTKLSDKVTLSENVGFDSPNVRNSKSSNSEWFNAVECGSNNISNVAKPREAISTDVPPVGSLSSSCFEKLGSTAVINGPSNASHPLKSSDAYSSSGRVHAVSSGKSGKTDDVHVDVAKLPHVSSCSSNCKNGLKTSMLKVVDQFRGAKFPKHHQLGGTFPYESFAKLYSWNKVGLQPCGLVNCGNSCYANAVLQCLTFTPPLTAYFLHGLHSKACAKKEWCFTCEFENLILKAKDAKSPLSPIGIISQLQNIGSQLSNGKEEDAHEFLRYAIDAMQSVCLKEAGMVSSGCSEEETTLIGLTFGGYLRSRIKCMKCQGKSERHERMMDLTVEIEGDIGTLEEALRRFTRTEILDGENKYQCSRCKSYEKAKKKFTILEAPNVLTIALKRFQSGKFGKLNKAIRFPEILNLAPYMSGTSDKSPIYRLYGVVVHLDIMNAAFSGHYLSYVRNVQNKWFKIDDSTVTSTELERVLTKGAYMLLYARCSPRAPRLMRSRNKAIPLRVNSKNPLKSSSFTHFSVEEFCTNSIPPDIPGSIESFYSKYNQLQRVLEDSSSSDTSLFSNNSDEGSCCTDSTRDSTSADDLFDSVFGDSIHGWNSPWRSSDSDASSSSSSSPLYSRHSPLADLDRYASGSTAICSSRMDGKVKGDVPFCNPTRVNNVDR